ncbi:MAG: hypothetical protein ACE5IR_19610 [bacterium]
MDPNLFYIDWARLFEALSAIVVLAFLIERALSLLFESRFFINRAQGKNLKELIAFGTGVLVCWYWDFDAVSIIFLKENVTVYGAVITGAVVAGGSKASVKLFRDILGFKSTAEAARQAKIQVVAKGGKTL